MPWFGFVRLSGEHLATFATPEPLSGELSCVYYVYIYIYIYIHIYMYNRGYCQGVVLHVVVNTSYILHALATKGRCLVAKISLID